MSVINQNLNSFSELVKLILKCTYSKSNGPIFLKQSKGDFAELGIRFTMKLIIKVVWHY